MFNPLPNVTDAEVLERAKLDMIEPREAKMPFALEWTHGGGLEKEYMRLNPGERHIMRDSDAALLVRELGEQGVISHPLNASVEEVKRLVLQALQRAQQFWSFRGGQRLTEFRKKSGLGKDEIEDHRYDLYAFHYNQALADILADKIAELRKDTKAAAPKAA